MKTKIIHENVHHCDEVNVYEKYDRMANWFEKNRNRDLGENKYLDQIIATKSNKLILDLGCGMGEPIASYLIENGCEVWGVDGSKELINKAQAKFPNAKWKCIDMREYSAPVLFDSIVAWHSLFHIQLNEQVSILQEAASWVKKSGLFIFTTGHKKSIETTVNGGEVLYQASLDSQEYKEILEKSGFKIISFDKKNPDCGNANIWVCERI